MIYLLEKLTSPLRAIFHVPLLEGPQYKWEVKNAEYTAQGGLMREQLIPSEEKQQRSRHGLTRRTHEATAAYTSKRDLWPLSIQQHPFQCIWALSKYYVSTVH